MAESIIKMTGGVIRQQKNTILKDVNIEIQSGEFVYLIGKVGSGKSSFLKTLYAELPLDYGTAEVAGFQLKKIKKSQIPLLRRKCGIVFQDFKLLIDRNVYANLEFVLRATGWKNKKAIKERIETVLSKVGMTDQQYKMPHQLSGGEQQRIVLARALLNAPPLILADEPTGNIDPETSYQLLELLKEICETGKTIIIATHQYDLIEKYPGRVFCCENGALFEKTQARACECTEEVSVAMPETEEIIPEDNASGNVPENIASTKTIPETEVTGQTVTGNLPEDTVTRNITGPQEPTSGIAPKTTENPDEDIISLIGKLEYPEITAFDYELDQLPEITPEAERTIHEETIVHQEIVISGNPEEILQETSISVKGNNEGTQDNPAESTPKDKKGLPPIMDLELID